jgi:MOSC domain-containing protein YiiM
MISHWLGLKRPQSAATLKAIYIASAAGEPMQSVDSIEAVEGCGLQGDRYFADAGHWQSIEGCQATLITEHELRSAKHKTTTHIETELENGGHRRNLVIDGLKTKQLEGKSFRIGNTVFRYEKPRPPCAYIDQIAGSGMGRALSHNSGICIKVISSGHLTVGDIVTVLP